jgi:phage repressor protein C with HTH and peptisase S24 domain
MAKGKATAKQAQTTVGKPKANQKSQARKSGRRPQKGTRCQKRPASDGSDSVESSGTESKGPSRPRKKSRNGPNGRGRESESDEEIEEEKDDDSIELVDNDRDV